MKHTKATRALVCGLPYSGNRIVRELCNKAGVICRAWHGHDDRVNRSPMVRGWKGPKYRAIISVRDPRVWEMAMKARRLADPTGTYFSGSEPEYRMAVLEELGQMDVPTLIIPYESVVRDPLWMGAYLWNFLGVKPPQGASVEDLWGQGIHDGDQKYEEQLVEAT